VNVSHSFCNVKTPLVDGVIFGVGVFVGVTVGVIVFVGVTVGVGVGVLVGQDVVAATPNNVIPR